MSLGDVMCKYKHIGTDMNIRPYKKVSLLDVAFEPKRTYALIKSEHTGIRTKNL